MTRDKKLLIALGKTLRVERTNPECPVPLEEVADKAGCTKSHLSNVERGLSSPEFSLVYKIANALGISFLELVAAFEERHRSLSIPKKSKSSERTTQ